VGLLRRLAPGHTLPCRAAAGKQGVGAARWGEGRFRALGAGPGRLGGPGAWPWPGGGCAGRRLEPVGSENPQGRGAPVGAPRASAAAGAGGRPGALRQRSRACAGPRPRAGGGAIQRQMGPMPPPHMGHGAGHMGGICRAPHSPPPPPPCRPRSVATRTSFSAAALPALTGEGAAAPSSAGDVASPDDVAAAIPARRADPGQEPQRRPPKAAIGVTRCAAALCGWGQGGEAITTLEPDRHDAHAHGSTQAALCAS
jgi:hypothetical protein